MYPKKSIEYLSQRLDKTQQAFYDNSKRKKNNDLQDAIVLTLVKELRKNHPKMGTTKLAQLLQSDLEKHNIKMGRDKLHALLRDYGFTVRTGKYKPHTTNSNHPYRRYSNLIADLEVTEANKLWVSDITYISTKKGFSYLSLITDAYSHKIVGWSLLPNMKSELVLEALKMALSTNTLSSSLIHHSDRGIQYCSNDYVAELERNKISISMTQNGDPYENAVAERMNGILKMEYNLKDEFSDYYASLEQTKKAILLYNDYRPHKSCNMLTPSQAHNQKGELKKHWKPKKYGKNQSNLQAKHQQSDSEQRADNQV